MGYNVNEMQVVANAILEENGENSLPIDIIRIIKNNDFSIYKVKLPDQMTGALLVNDTAFIGKTGLNKLILVENNANTQRGRFISAHEFGHYILHKTEKEQLFAHRDYIHSNELCEREADLFARSVLMPLDRLLDEIKKNKSNLKNQEDLIDFISTKCAVTENKAKDRIWDLISEKKIEFKANGCLEVM